MVPSNKKSSCNTRPRCWRYDSRITDDRLVLSIKISPEVGFKNEATKPAKVDLPEPDEPTKAVIVPAGASSVMFFITSLLSW